MNNIHNNGAEYGGNGIFDDQNSTGHSYIGNYIHDNGRISIVTNLDQGMYLCGTNNEVVVNNLIVGNCSFGIQVAAYYNIANMDIYNNTIVSNRNRSGIVLWGAGGNVSGIDIANNIFYGNAGPGVLADSCAGSGVQIRNNLLLNNSGAQGSGPWYMTFDGSTVSYTTSGNITNSDPEFFNNANNWHLQKCSPAIDSGLTLSAVTSDYDGLPRPIPLGGTNDIGAYER